MEVGDGGGGRRWEEVLVSCSTLTGGLVAAFRDSISAWVIHTLLVDCRRQTCNQVSPHDTNHLTSTTSAPEL